MRVFIIFILATLLFSDSEREKYKMYVEKIINYSFELKDFNKIEEPFYIPITEIEKNTTAVEIEYKKEKKEKDKEKEKEKKLEEKNINKKDIKKVEVIKPKNLSVVKRQIFIRRYDFDVVSILEDQVLIKLREYVNDKLIGKYKKWIKLHGKFKECILFKIDMSDAYFKCKNKIIRKTLNKRSLF